MQLKENKKIRLRGNIRKSKEMKNEFLHVPLNAKLALE
jgi:hypothetical protein